MADNCLRRFALRRLIPLGLLILAGVAFALCGGRRYLTFAALAEHREFLEGLVAASGALAALGYILIYAALTAMSVPGAMLMTLAGGLLFGPWLGALYALTAATLGATAVFLAARYGLYGLAARIGARAERLEGRLPRGRVQLPFLPAAGAALPFWRSKQGNRDAEPRGIWPQMEAQAADELRPQELLVRRRQHSKL